MREAELARGGAARGGAETGEEALQRVTIVRRKSRAFYQTKHCSGVSTFENVILTNFICEMAKG
jgi:hypothetical protein